MSGNDLSQWAEAAITINGSRLSLAESMTLRVAVSSFRMQLHDQAFREALGVELAIAYDRHCQTIERKIIEGI